MSAQSPQEYRSTRRGKPVRKSRWTGTGYHWIGRDDRGVSIWEGTPKALKFGSIILAITGSVSFGIGALIAILGKPTEVFYPLCLVGVLHVGIAWWMNRHHRGMAGMGTIDELAETMGVDADDLNRVAAEKGIRPRIILNQRAVYDPADFGGPGTLLRSSAAPDGALLRVAASAETPEDQLLRPSPAGPGVEPGIGTGNQPAEVHEVGAHDAS